jgi:hypothetical protein
MQSEPDLYCADEDDGLESRCGGSRTLHCFCGGDLCVCGNQGEVECPGCPDCNYGDFDDDDGFYAS